MVRRMTPTTWSKIWSALCPRSTSSKLLFTLSLDKRKAKKSIWESPKISSKWWGLLLQKLTQFQEDNAWPNASTFWNSSMTYSFTWDQSSPTLLMMMISTGITVSPLPQQRNSRRLKKQCWRCKNHLTSKNLSTFHGCANALWWISNLTWLGKSTLTWKHPMSPSTYWTWLQMTVTKWDNSITH